ncbi:hypothetical protein ABZT49_13590 [Methylobacterium sp. EM32]|uniref:hypothetical protein n=1 Tax=Methylobacterium sp. EM32 TaxID=3163481 RepID=UPI0033B85029
MLDTIPSLPADENSNRAPDLLVLNENLVDRPLTAPTDEHSTIVAINEACAACQAIGGDDGFFGDSWKRRVNELLLPSYGLHLLIHNDPDQIVRVAREGSIKTTKATEKNSALIAIKLAARPDDTHEEKLCSDWATVLLFAQSEQITVEGFPAWVENVTVAECKREVAAQRRAAKLAAGTAPRARAEAPASEGLGSSDSEAPRLELRLLGADGPAEEAVELPEVVYPTLLAALTEPGARSVLVERLWRSLLLLADELRMAESDAAQAAEVAHG